MAFFDIFSCACGSACNGSSQEETFPNRHERLSLILEQGYAIHKDDLEAFDELDDLQKEEVFAEYGEIDLDYVSRRPTVGTAVGERITIIPVEVRRESIVEGVVDKISSEEGRDTLIVRMLSQTPLCEILPTEADVSKTARKFLRANRFKTVNEKKKGGCLSRKIDTPLHLAVRQDNYAVTNALLERGADITVMNHNKKTAKQLVKKGSPIARLFEAKNGAA